MAQLFCMFLGGGHAGWTAAIRVPADAGAVSAGCGLQGELSVRLSALAGERQCGLEYDGTARCQRCTGGPFEASATPFAAILNMPSHPALALLCRQLAVRQFAQLCEGWRSAFWHRAAERWHDSLPRSSCRHLIPAVFYRRPHFWTCSWAACRGGSWRKPAA